MPIIERQRHTFWDHNAIFPGRCLSDDFEDAGIEAEHEDTCTITVMDITLEKAMEIAKPSGAAYLGTETFKVRVPDCAPGQS